MKWTRAPRPASLAKTQPRSAKRRRILRRSALIIIGVAISLGVAGVVRDTLREEARTQGEIARQSLAAGLQSHITRELEFLLLFRGLYNSSDFVSETEFRQFARLDPGIATDRPWINVAWARRRAVQYPEMLETFPITYVNAPRSDVILLTNAATDQRDREIMSRAAKSGDMRVGEPRILQIDGHQTLSVKLFLPVFNNPQAAVPSSLQGFLIATISLEGFFDAFLSDALTETPLSVRIRDGGTLLFQRGSFNNKVTPIKLAVGDREWALQVEASAQVIQSGLWLPALVFATGLALTALLYLRLQRAETEYERIAGEVRLATAELADANQRLAERSTKLQQVADDLRQTSRDAQFANASKTVFLANMSHELRTPLNAVIGFSEIIANRVFGDDSLRYVEYASDIRSSGHYLLAIIEGLLDMSRIELGHVKLAEEPAELVNIVDEVVKFVILRADEKNIAIRREGLDRLPTMFIDPKAMRQVLLNLLTNAVKFSPPGSVVEIRGQVQSDGVALSVIDQGIGIENEDLPHVFNPFWQSEAYRRQAKDGAGLGLAITKGLVHAHDATIDVQSRVHHGTTVTVLLPAKRIVNASSRLMVIK